MRTEEGGEVGPGAAVETARGRTGAEQEPDGLCIPPAFHAAHLGQQEWTNLGAQPLLLPQLWLQPAPVALACSAF